MRSKTFLLLLVLSLPLPSLAQDAMSSDGKEIRRVRAASNAAIARHDVTALPATWVADIHVTASSGRVFTTSEEVTKAFAGAFSDPTFVTYVRTPRTVEVDQSATFAAESGEWIGRWQKDDGEMNVRGVYLAQWKNEAGKPADSHWRIRSELYVALSCSGSAACP
jgi:ketosteroid isomerase-like protein